LNFNNFYSHNKIQEHFITPRKICNYMNAKNNRIHRICQVIEASTPRWKFEGGMREAAREALAILRHKASERMENSWYHHFPSRAEEGAEVMVLPAGDHGCIGCFTNQVKLTRALVQDLDEAI
jgi:hypothetical protein